MISDLGGMIYKGYDSGRFLGFILGLIFAILLFVGGVITLDIAAFEKKDRSNVDLVNLAGYLGAHIMFAVLVGTIFGMGIGVVFMLAAASNLLFQWNKRFWIW